MNTISDPLYLNDEKRSQLWNALCDFGLRYPHDVAQLPVERIAGADTLRSLIQQFDFNVPLEPREAFTRVVNAMMANQTHTAHPRYFGLFNPNPTSMGVIGEALAAIFNTQLAAWTHAPFAVQMETHLVREIGRRFDERLTHGCFTTGGAEANVTAMVCALIRCFAQFSTLGMRGIASQPVAYVSAAAHHSFVKAARVVGLGTTFLRVVPCDASHRMDVAALQGMIADDEQNGYTPFFVVATAGATASGIVESIEDIGKIAKAHDAWFHVDAAWGGFAALVPELRASLAGLERADSLTFDPHKMMSVPMGAGMFLTSDAHVLGESFAVVADYMPARDAEDDRADPFTHSIQWSRRFIGLKVLLSLAVAGWDGYASALREQVRLGAMLREELRACGWHVVNDTPFPVSCAVPPKAMPDVTRIVRRLVEGGNVWVSQAVLPDGTPVLRACITNYLTTESDMSVLGSELRRCSM